MPSIRTLPLGALALAALFSAALPLSLRAAEPAASEGSGEAPRGALLEFKPAEAKPVPLPQASADEASRATPFETEAWLVQTYTALGRNADGSEVKVAPSESLMGLLKAAAGTAEPGNGDNAGTAAKTEGVDPAYAEGEEASRQVFGDDERVQIGNTQTYPFRAFGFIQSEVGGGFSSCSGTLIGPRTVLTAAHCLYSHEDKGWGKNITFFPGANGEGALPYGGFEFQTAYVVEGYVDNYQDQYGSVLPWDVGVIILKEPIGENLGWLSFADYRDLGDFSVNIVGYPGDKPIATMWRTTCDVTAENVTVGDFTYDCDTYPGSSGSSVYLYDASIKQRVVVGVNVAENQAYNTAVRLNPGFVEWILNLRQ